MQKRTLKVALLAVLATVLVFGMSSAALADQTWKDLPDTVTAKYGITDNQVAGISEGFAGGLWKPYKNVTRAQFTKMAVTAFNIPLANSAIASYTDVPKSNFYYKYVEGAKAAGVVTGTTATTFSPNLNITRQQAIAIVARYIAKAQGYDLATMYTADQIAALLSHFGDAGSISADLKDEVAFAFDMGLTKGDDYGNIKPLANLTRIQGAAFLIRAQALVPPKLWVPAKLELVSTDKTEGLIGQVYSVTLKVTTSDGHPAKGVLIDFDALTGAEFYVGQVEQEAAVTDSNGEVTVNLLSLEPGTQRMSASVNGVGILYVTRYWLALDEVYNVNGAAAQNNAGVEHTWGVRVVVFGPGPMSTSQNDWYNAVETLNTFDPKNIDASDGVDAICYGWVVDDMWDYADELELAAMGYKPRTLAGIDVEWAIYNKTDDPLTKLTNEAVTSVGNIIKVDGTAITPAKTAVGKTNADGYSSIVIDSEVVGKTLTEAVADYAKNPYPEQLFNHDTFQDWQWHDEDWWGQPSWNATQVKTWISHVIGAPTGPISPAYSAPNIGEEKTLTITLVDSFGNPVVGKSIEWYMQGVGFFQTDDAGDNSDPYTAANNKDFDITDAQGKATLFVKSYDSGEQIVHAKVRDKGTGGAEGSYMTYTAEVQWFDVDMTTFDNITTVDQWVYDYDYEMYLKVENNEALSTNAVNGSHTFDLWVYGLKLEYDSSIEEPDGQTPYVDSDAALHSYDGIFDARDAAYFGGILMCPASEQLQIIWDDKIKLYYDTQAGLLPIDVNGNGIIEANAEVWVDLDLDGQKDPSEITHIDERGTGKIKVAGAWLTLSFEGAYTEYDYNDNGYKEPFLGEPGIYLPLAGKTVRFTIANEDGLDLSNLGAYFDGATIDAAGTGGNGSITPRAPTSATTDATGKAGVVITSKQKGPETIKAVVDWVGNPHNGAALATAYAKKTWSAGTVATAGDVTIEIWIDDVKIATNKEGVLKDALGNPLSGESLAYETDTNGDYILNSAHIDVHVLDVYGNDLPDYEIVYLLESINSWVGGSQDSANTYVPWSYLVDLYDDLDPDDETINYDQNGNRPDSDEPRPLSDPYGRIVGPGYAGGAFYTEGQAFFFNQWLGSEKPVDGGHAGLEVWWTKTSGLGFLGYHADYLAAAYHYQWPANYPGADELFDGFDGVIDGSYTLPYNYPAWPTNPYHVGLATDAAKAWTLDSYYDADDGVAVDIQPNLLTGSCLDIQLADAFVEDYALLGAHLKSILRVMVYAPADGLVIEGAFLWSVQVHQVWEIPVPTSISLAPATDYAIAGEENTTLVATVLDQFDDPMPNVDVYFTSEVLEGDIDQTFAVDTPVGATDEFGNVAVEFGQDPATWGVERVTAWIDDGTVDGLTSNASVIQWIFNDSLGVALDTVDPVDTFGPNLVGVVAGQQKTTVIPGFYPWNGKTIRIYTNPGSTLLGQGTYVTLVGVNVTTSMTWETGQGVFVNANTSNTDEIPNWLYDVVP